MCCSSKNSLTLGKKMPSSIYLEFQSSPDKISGREDHGTTQFQQIGDQGQSDCKLGNESTTKALKPQNQQTNHLKWRSREGQWEFTCNSQNSTALSKPADKSYQSADQGESEVNLLQTHHRKQSKILSQPLTARQLEKGWSTHNPDSQLQALHAEVPSSKTT